MLISDINIVNNEFLCVCVYIYMENDLNYLCYNDLKYTGIYLGSSYLF